MLYREQKLVIRLTRAEREAIRALATRERLPDSTLARLILLKAAARERGLWPGLDTPTATERKETENA